VPRTTQIYQTGLFAKGHKKIGAITARTSSFSIKIVSDCVEVSNKYEWGIIIV
jgi:hypothetical protein